MLANKGGVVVTLHENNQNCEVWPHCTVDSIYSQCNQFMKYISFTNEQLGNKRFLE